ncbi:monofunctional biosynthetic peptidoglycan transglycosylase [Acidobacteriota bacterium]
MIIGLPLTGLGVMELSHIRDVRKLRESNPGKTAMMQYRIDQAQRKGEETPRVTQFWVSLDRVSEPLTQAIVTAEDDRFYSHRGFDTVEIKKAAELNLREGTAIRGASTISQQLAKNLYLSPKKRFTRKIQEATITVAIEKSISKERILELYVNIIEMGRGVFGVEAASRWYFRKPASEIEPHEATLMATAIPAPLRRNPACPSEGHKKLARRLLYRLKNKNALSDHQLREALAGLDTMQCVKNKDAESGENSEGH